MVAIACGLREQQAKVRGYRAPAPPNQSGAPAGAPNGGEEQDRALPRKASPYGRGPDTLSVPPLS